MIREVVRDLKAIGELLRHSLSSSRKLRPAERTIEYHTPNLSSRWELSFVNNTEKTIYEKMVSEFDAGDVFYDVGANIGFYTCMFSDKASRVYSFEPNEYAVNLLEKNINTNSLTNVEIKQVAASDENTSKELAKVPSGSVLGTAKVMEKEKGDIDAKRIDDMYNREGIELPDIVKIDVEGHEKEVIKGMERVMYEGSPVIYVESHNEHSRLEELLESFGYNYEKLNRRLEGNVFYRAEPNGSIESPDSMGIDR